MNRSIKLLEALNDIDEQLLVEYKETTKEKNSHKSYKERVIGMSNLKLKYVLAPVCVVLIAIVGYVGFLNTNNNLNNNPITDFRGGKEESLATTININKISDIGMASLDADIRVLNNVMIPYFGYMANLAIPEDFDNKEDYKAIYVRNDVKVENYDVLNNYEFTYQVLNALKKDYKSDTLYLIMGYDNLKNLHLWKNIDEILENKIIVLRRGNIDIDKYLNRFDKSKFIIIDNFDYVDISSTELRKNLDSKYLSDKVINYIKRKKLYKGD